jgi:hypothetical protein
LFAVTVLVVLGGILQDGDRAVRKYLARRPLRRRIIALAAAYAIALSSLIASFGAAHAAAEAALIPGGIICHTVVPGEQAPAQDNGKICLDCCCGVGCTMAMAALPPPPATAAPLAQASSERITPHALAVLTGAPGTKSHRSRAPPLNA